MTSYAEWLALTPILIGRKFRVDNGTYVYTIVDSNEDEIKFNWNNDYYNYRYRLTEGRLFLLTSEAAVLSAVWLDP